MERKDDRDIEAIRAFNRFYTNIIGALDRHILGSPYSLTEARILLEIFHDNGCNARTIRERLNVDEGYLSRTIDSLVKCGLIEKRRSPEDGRVLVLNLTSGGEKALLKLSSDSAASIREMLRHLSSIEVGELVAHMRGIEKLLRKNGSTDAHDH